MTPRPPLPTDATGRWPGSSEACTPPRLRAQAMALYAQRAPVYDLELAPFEALRQEAIAALQLQPGQTVLDVGCGTGLSLPGLHAGVGAQGRVCALEQSPPMLTQARTRCAGWSGLSLLQAAAEEAPWPSDLRADAALFFFTHDILQQPEALRRAFAALAPGARVVAVGLCWAPPWLPLSNCFVLGASLHSIAHPVHLEAPWQDLAPRLRQVHVARRCWEAVYLLTGRV